MLFSDASERVPCDAREQERRARFERIWRQYQPRIRLLVARLAGNVDAADDLTQEVGIRAFQAFDTFRGSSQPFTWLYRIAINVVNARRRVQTTISLSAAEASRICTSRAVGPEATALAADVRAVVRDALMELPEEQRTCLILQHYEGLKHREIAAILGIPQGTVASRIHTALKRLRLELNDDVL